MREHVTTVSGETTTTTESVWAGAQLAMEQDSDGTLYRYVYGPGGLPLELIVTPEGESSTSCAYQCHAAGSVIALTDSSGTAVATYTYDPYGRVLSVGGSDLALASRNPLRYRGYYYDTTTEHYYLPVRYYDPSTARFLSADPASPSAGDPLTLNRYAYCVGDPVNASDPSGAVMVQGSGVTAPVSSDAVQFAKEGNLDAAKKTQSYFRDQLTTCRPRYGFEGAIGMAEFNTGHFAFQLREEEAYLQRREELDHLADTLAAVSAVSGTISTAAYVLAGPSGGAAAVVGAVAGWISIGATAAGVVVTEVRFRDGYIDSSDRWAAHTLSAVSVGATMMGAGAANALLGPGMSCVSRSAGIAGAALEWGD